jgi:hypothetical protein
MSGAFTRSLIATLLTAGCSAPNDVVATVRPKTWAVIGEPLTVDATTPADQPALILDENDAPIVAWSQAVGSEPPTIHLRRWDGTQWVVIGDRMQGVIEPKTSANSPALTLLPDGAIVLGWEEPWLLAPGIYARQFRGSWGAFGAEPLPLTHSDKRSEETGRRFYPPHGFDTGPALAIDAAGQVVVAWSENGVEPALIHVSRFDGRSWKDTTIDGSDAVTPPALVAAPDGVLHLAWSDHDGLLHIAREGEDGWTRIATPTSPVSGRAYWPSLQIWRGDPVLAWEESVPPSTEGELAWADVRVRRFTNGSWVLLGETLGAAAPTSSATHVRVVAHDERLVLLWVDRDLANVVTYGAPVMGWDGDSEWQPVAPRLPALLKANNNGGPAIALDSAGKAVVAYKEQLGDALVLRVVREAP